MAGKKHPHTQKTLDELLQFIKDYKLASSGGSPSRREMADAFGVSTSVINYYLKELVGQGRLQPFVKQRPRQIAIGDSRTVKLWLCPDPDCETILTQDEYIRSNGRCGRHDRPLVLTEFVRI